MYADDTQLYLSFHPKDLVWAKKLMEDCISEIRLWLCGNCLKLNDTKTEFMIIGQPHHLKVLSESFTSLTIGEVSVAASSSAGNLGAVIDCNLKMDKQVGNVCRSCYAYLRWLGQIRRYLSDSSAAKLVHSFISSKLDNLNSLLINIPAYQLKRLQLIQNNAARIVMRIGLHMHISETLQDLHWLPMKARIDYKVLLLTFKALNGQAPIYLTDLLHYKRAARTLRSSKNHLLEVPKTRLVTVGDRSFSAHAPRVWNSLPLDVRLIENVECFKKEVKTFLFKQYFCIS